MADGGLPHSSSPFRCACVVGPALVVDRVCAGARVIRSAHLFARAVARAGHERTCSPDCVWIATRPGGLPRHPSPSDALASLDPRWPDGHSRAGALVTRCPLLPSLTQQLGRECAFPCHAIVRLRLPRQYAGIPVPDKCAIGSIHMRSIHCGVLPSIIWPSPMVVVVVAEVVIPDVAPSFPS